MWFVDFVLAHKHLSISDLVSIEKDPYVASRAEFNRPYACVSVEKGESQVVLPSLALEEKKLVVWVDYDTSVNGPVFEDLATLCTRVLSGSVVIVTINADKSSLSDKDADGQILSSDEERLRCDFGNFSYLIPQQLPKRDTQLSQYRAFLARMIFQHMRRQVHTAGRTSDCVVPLFNIAYSDNALMLTVGAAIVDTQDVSKTECVLRSRNVGPMDEHNQLRIGVPPLTLREKAALDQLMPCRVVPTEAEISQDLGFLMKPSQIAAYHRYYRYYPMFGELAI